MSREDSRLFEKTPAPLRRLSLTYLVLLTLFFIFNKPTLGLAPESSLNLTAGTSQCMSILSRSGPDIFALYCCICMGVQTHSFCISPKYPHGHGFMAPMSMITEG